MNAIKFDVPMKEITYKVFGERKLKLYVCEPEKSALDKPAILFFNGGSFKKVPYQSPLQFQHQANYFASKGMLAICVDYRNGSDEGFTPIQAICDVKSAVRWVRENSVSLGVDPGKVVICGSSAGGYITVSSIMFPDLNNVDDDQEIDPVPNALVVFNAVMDAVDIMTRRYPELIEKAVDLSPIHNIKNCLPPTLWLSGTVDEDFEKNTHFIKNMKASGNDISVIIYEGMEHGFFNFGKHKNKYYHETILRVEEFLESLRFL